MSDPSANRGIWYMTGGWVFTSLALIAVVLRLYTRVVLTRSIGSDDFAMIPALLSAIAGSVTDTIVVKDGFGRHIEFLNNSQIENIEKIEYTGWIRVFISYFFVRASVMLFTLRLLPCTKKWPRRIINAAVALNFAITLIACVCYGVKCTPFEATWKSVPNAHCKSETMFTASQIVNGLLSCIIDMTTAAIPAFLLWGLKMKRKTKSILHTIFLLGLVTAGLSIGRAVTTKNSTWAVDMTWNSTVNGSFSFTEEKIGIVLASCPMIRQGIVYAFRHKTLCPTSRRIPPNDDFVAMRKRIKLRDIFWYRQTEPRELLPPQPLSAEKPRDISPRDQEVKKSGLDHVWRNFVQIFRLDRRVPDVEQDGQNGVNGVVVERKDMITETEGGSEDDASEGRTAKKAGDSETFLLSRTNASAMEWPLTTSSAKGSPLASGGRSFA